MIHFDVNSLKKEIDKLEEKSTSSNFWDDSEKAQEIMKKLNNKKEKLKSYTDLKEKYEDILTLIDMAIEEEDSSLESEILNLYNEFKKEFKEVKMNSLLTGDYDSNDAIVSLHSGAGGDEACDWVAMLFRMYKKWTDKRGFNLEVLDKIPGEVAGFKSVTFEVNGKNAYGLLNCEKGVHRLVRISPFDSSNRRHTSFAACDVMPVIEDDKDIDINDEDLRIDTYRSSGAGGQHVNTSDSAVRITHIPTNIVVQCQNERSQHKNKQKALKMLKAKIFDKREQERKEKLGEIRGDVKHIDFGSQIRSYVFHPYMMVKDHRTNLEVGNADSVMDGDLDQFINEYLLYKKGVD